MSTYRVEIECGNCFSSREYDIERGVSCADADLVCPNCGCCPTENQFGVITVDKQHGKPIKIKLEIG